MTEISTRDKLASATRELAFRRRAYPKWIASGRYKQETADREIACMEAIVHDYANAIAKEEAAARLNLGARSKIMGLVDELTAAIESGRAEHEKRLDAATAKYNAAALEFASEIAVLNAVFVDLARTSVATFASRAIGDGELPATARVAFDPDAEAKARVEDVPPTPRLPPAAALDAIEKALDEERAAAALAVAALDRAAE